MPDLIVPLQIVGEYLKTANGIIIVADITRAISNKTAKKLIGEKFRRQLILDGQHRNLIFVATKTDVLNAGEARITLKLPPKATKRECALSRNNHVVQAISKDFNEGMEEFRKSSTTKELSVELPVICVSSLQYQLMENLRDCDEEVIIYKDKAETGIPQLQTLILRRALQCQKDTYSEILKTVRSIFRGIESALGQEGYSKEREDLLDKVSEEVDSNLKVTISTINSSLKTRFECIENKVNLGVRDAKKSVEGKAAKWIQTNHQTFRAALVRDGEYSKFDINDSLCESILAFIAEDWDDEFNNTLPADIKQTLEQGVEQVFKNFASGSDQLCPLLKERIYADISVLLHDLASILVSQSRDLNRSMVPEVSMHSSLILLFLFLPFTGIPGLTVVFFTPLLPTDTENDADCLQSCFIGERKGLPSKAMSIARESCQVS
jgi:hypothetical protein